MLLILGDKLPEIIVDEFEFVDNSPRPHGGVVVGGYLRLSTENVELGGDSVDGIVDFGTVWDVI